MMNEILAFLKALEENNNREWFTAHKELYQELHKQFEAIVNRLIGEIALFDEEVKGLEAKDCVYRIYRDVRFSPDKRPYKNHFGAFMAPRGGRKSIRAGYYLHLQPGNSFISGGIYCPEPGVLKRLRQDVYDNVDEFKSILGNKEFKREFGGLDNTNCLKNIPQGFPKDFKDGELLKHKDYTVLSPKPDTFFVAGDTEYRIIEVFKKLYTFNRFLNYTIDEMN